MYAASLKLHLFSCLWVTAGEEQLLFQELCSLFPQLREAGKRWQQNTLEYSPKPWVVLQEIRKPSESSRAMTAMSVLRGQEKHEESMCVFPSERLQDFVALFPYLFPSPARCTFPLHGTRKLQARTSGMGKKWKHKPVLQPHSLFFFFWWQHPTAALLDCFPFGTCGGFTVFTLVFHLCLRHSPFFL